MQNLKDWLKDFKGNRVLMTIYPHPDDETMGCGGLLMTAKGLGFHTVVVCLTKGEAGQNHTRSRGRKLADIREEELRRALKVLRVDELRLGNFGDGKLREGKSRWIPWVADMIKKYRPGIVVTYDHSGNSGHPDHIVLSVECNKIVRRLKDQPVFLWTSVLGRVRKNMLSSQVATFASNPDFYLDLRMVSAGRKWLAAKSHPSQKLGSTLPLPFLVFSLIFRREWYHQVDLGRSYPYKFVEFKI